MCGIGMNEKDGSRVQLLGGIAPLCVGQSADLCQNVLFHNPSEKTLTLLRGDVIGHAKLAETGEINPEWSRTIESQANVHALTPHAPGQEAVSPERTQQLVQQLGIMDNRLLANHPEVRQTLINLITRYESVFTDDDNALGKTELIKMRIVLQPHVTPVRAAVRKIKLQ